MKYVRYVFFILSIVFLGYFICGQVLLTSDGIDGKNVCYEYTEPIWAIQEDGTKVLIENGSKFGKVNRIETVIPDNMDPRVTNICFGAKDSKVYLDERLIYEYSTKDYRWFGNSSPERFLMIPISVADAGKTLSIELEMSTGILYQVYIGNEYGIWRSILKQYAGELIVAAITLIMGCLTILISTIYGQINHRKFEIGYLGFGVAYAAVWLVVNSVYRQVIFSNLSVASDLPFMMVMLIPYPFLIYMDIIQEKRYAKLYLASSGILTIVNIINVLLYVTGIKELVDTFIFVALACGMAILSVIFSFVVDLKKGKITEYRYVAIGLFCAFFAAIIQLVTYFNRTGIFSGAYLAIGLLCLLVGAAIHTVRNIFQIEKDKKAAVIASAEKGKFLAKMSHEIRTPINAVLGMDEMILRETNEPQVKEYALDIQNAGRSLLALINDILDISKIESGKMEIVPVEYDMSSMINDTMNMIYHKAKEKDLAVELDVDENIPSRLKGDDIRIRQILINIMNNAVKYTPEGSVTLKVTGSIVEDGIVQLKYSVTDTGIGIKEEDLPKLYEQFQRIEEQRNRNIEGTGLGMSITLQLLELMDSKLDVSSEYGKGSCFYFTLKQEIVDKTPIGNLSERIQAQALEHDYVNTFSALDARILVVDDNSVNRKVVRNLLKDIGPKIDEVDSGEKCLEMICEKKYDLIFLDHMMPGMDGIQTLQKFGEIKDNMNLDTPVVALTANAVTGAKEMYLEAGFTDFLTKPVMYGKLEQMLLKHLPEQKVSAPVSKKDVPGTIENESVRQGILEDISDLNLDYALMVNGNRDMLFDTLVDFAKMLEADATELNRHKDSLPDEDAIKQYRVKVHSMKASAMLVGLMYLGGMARMLELAAIKKDIDTISSMHDIFIKEWLANKSNLQPVLDQHKKENADNEPKEYIEINKGLIIEQLEMLIDAVIDVDVDRADEIVELLKGFDYSENMQEVMEKIYSAVSSLDDSLLKVYKDEFMDISV